MNKLSIFLIKIYRKYLSGLKKPCCRFIPTCSEYALEAFSVFSFYKAFGLTLWRLLRCNPFCKGGYDPVPVAGRKNTDKN